MPTREEMRRLGDEIVRSYEDRIGGMARVKEAEGERKRTTAKKIAHRRSDAGARASDVGAMLKEFDDARATMSKGLRAELAKVASTLEQAEGERKRTATLEIAHRKSDVGAMLKDVDAKLKELDDAHATMSKGLKAELARAASALERAEGERKRTAAKETSHRRSDAGARVSDVGAMLSEFREDQVGARDEWQKATATMQSKQGGVAVAVKPPVEEIAKAVVQQPEAHGQRGGDRPPAPPRALRVRGNVLP